MYATTDERRGIPAVDGISVRASVRWKPSSRRQRKATLPSELEGIAYMPRAVVTGSGKPPRKRRTIIAPVVIRRMTIADLPPSNNGNPDA